MIQTITVANFWSILSKDVVYKQNALAISIADYLCKEASASLTFLYHGSAIHSFNHGESSREITLSMCEALDFAYANSHDTDPSWKASVVEINAEVLVRTMLAVGLTYTLAHAASLDDPYRHDFFSFVLFSGLEEINRDDLESFFSMWELPQPSSLFPNAQCHTEYIASKFSLNSFNWNTTISASDLVNSCHELSIQPRQVESRRHSYTFVSMGEFYHVIFKGKKFQFKCRHGLAMIYYLVEHQNKSIGISELHDEIYKCSAINATKIDEVFENREAYSIQMYTDKHNYKKMRDKIVASLNRAYNAMKKQDPAISEHFRRAISTKGGFRYAPEEKISWVIE